MAEATKVKTYGLTHVAVAVRDVDRASAFYRKVFGAVVVYKEDGFVQLQTPGTRDGGHGGRRHATVSGSPPVTLNIEHGPKSAR